MTTTAIPTSSAELEEWMNDGERMTNVFKEGRFKEFVGNFQTANAKANPDIKAEIAEQVQLGMAQFMKDSGEKAGARRSTSPRDSPGGLPRSRASSSRTSRGAPAQRRR